MTSIFRFIRVCTRVPFLNTPHLDFTPPVKDCVLRRGAPLQSRFCYSSDSIGIGNNKLEHKNEYNLIELIEKFEETILPKLDSSPLDPTTDSIDKFLDQPQWSTTCLLEAKNDPLDPSSQSSISNEELRHLLRLSALPYPTDPAELEVLRQDLQSQLAFVRDIQRVDTEGVEPLVCVRNETNEGIRDLEITLDDLQTSLSKEYLKGKCLRPRRRNEVLLDEKYDYDLLGASENVTMFNGEKYVVVKHQVLAPTITEVREAELAFDEEN